MGVSHGHYLNHIGTNAQVGGWKAGDPEPWTKKATHEDPPLSKFFVSMLQRLGVETETFADSAGKLDGV